MGPFTPLPFTPEGDDICAQIEEHRTEIPMFEHMVTMDPPQHTDARSILTRLLTPKRLKENEDFMWRLADATSTSSSPTATASSSPRTQSRSRCWSLPICSASPRTTTRSSARRSGPRAGYEHRWPRPRGDRDQPAGVGWTRSSRRYIEERRESPRDDVLTSIATAKYPDGSTPEVVDVVRTATFLFAAGQETTAKLLGAAMRVLGDRPDIQQQLRDDRSRIPIFIEECLRMDSP